MSMPRLKRDPHQKGQAIVEFALAAIIFFTAFLAIVEFAHLFYVRLSLQHALREAGRFLVTGRDGVDSDGTTPVPRCVKDGTTGVITGAVVDRFYQNIKGFADRPTLTITSVSGTTCGGSKDSVTLRATYTKPWFSILANNRFLPGGVPLSVSMTWLTEPFPESGGG